LKIHRYIIISLLAISFVSAAETYEQLSLENDKRLLIDAAEHVVIEKDAGLLEESTVLTEENVALLDENSGLPAIDEVDGDVQPFEVSLEFKRVYTEVNLANGLGAANNTNKKFFVSQVDSGVTTDEWGEAFELNFDHFYHFTFKDNDYSVGAAVGMESFESKNSTSRSLGFGSQSKRGFVDLLPIDGARSPGAVFSFDRPDTNDDSTLGSVNSRYEAEFRRIYLNLSATRKVSSKFKISGSFHSSLSRLVLDSVVLSPNDVANRGRISLDQRVDSYSFGPLLRLQTDHQINDNVYLFLDTKFGILLSHGKLKAAQESVSEDGVNGVAGLRKTDDKSDDFAVFCGLESGLIFRMNESSKIAVSLGAEYRNDSYEIVHPRSSTGIDADDPNFFGGTSSYIEQVDLVNLYGGIEYTHIF